MSTWLPTAPCAPASCCAHRGPTSGAPRAAARLLAGVTVVLAGVLLAPATALLGPALRERCTRVWARAVLRGFGVRVRVTGRPPRRGRGVLVVANHISWLDIPLVATVLPGRMLAKTEIRHWPVLGLPAALGGTLFVDRERLRALPGTVRALTRALTAGSRVIVFPEGCTWCGRDQGRFTPAAFQAALDAGAPVCPVRITYRAPDGSVSGAPAFIGDDTLLVSLWRVAAARGLTAEITVLPPLPAEAPAVPSDAGPARRVAPAARRALASAAREAVVGTGGPRPRVTRPYGPRPGARTAARGVAPPPARQATVASDSANRPSPSVHQCANSSPARPSSARTPS
ncbi:hypothetical protein GCM10009654_53940 [Streptomyces hebeiensis]|uniref:Phospholipid/glycerol acyltransferase domain-containing protein n=1 Tax=Streptomyces hebeiensis TaxID=229486 RepID=A0ABN1V4F4_9ACTN